MYHTNIDKILVCIDKSVFLSLYPSTLYIYYPEFYPCYDIMNSAKNSSRISNTYRFVNEKIGRSFISHFIQVSATTP